MALKKNKRTYISISIKNQELSLYEREILIKRFSISTAKNGIGQQKK